MRRFTDAEGAAWEAVVGRESWGAFFAIFVPAATGELRQTILPGETWGEAEGLLDRMDEEEIRALLAASEPKRLD